MNKLEEILEKYKDHSILLNYFPSNCHECVALNYPAGWHCAIYKTSYKSKMNDDISNRLLDVIHVRGYETAYDALHTAVGMIF
jgi:hypothetical protein